MINQTKPLICTFMQLSAALAPLHLWNPGYVADLHDVWKKGAPTPNSIIRNPKDYDERKQQAGNYEARIVFPSLLAQWIENVATARGIPCTPQQAFLAVMGHADIGGTKPGA